MAQPITWTGFFIPNGGINETQSPQEIKDNQWAAARDAEPMPDGVRSRLGSATVNATAIGATVAITGIFDYRLSDNATTRHLVVAGTALYNQSAGTMTSIGTGFTADPNVYPSFSVARDICFIANGTDTPKKLYVSGTTNQWYDQGIAAPTTTATATPAAGGSLATGVWYVDYYFWNNDLGYPSNTRYAGATSLAATLSAGTQTINLTGLPTATVGTNEKATHVRIALRSPSGTVFRFAGTTDGQITLGTATASIDADATTDEIEYDYDKPPVHSMAVVAENRRFIAGIVGFPYRVQWSKVSGVVPYYDAYPAANYRDFGKGDGQTVTALAFVPPQTLVVGFKDQIIGIDARRPLTSDRYQIASGVGIAHHKAFIVVGRRMLFVSDADRTKGMMMWDGASVSQISGIDVTFKGLNKARLRYAVCEHYAPGDNRFQWWTLVTSGGGSQPDLILVYDYYLDSWSVYSVASGQANVLGTVEVSGSSTLYAGGRNGREYTRDTGSDDAGTTYTAYIEGKTFDFGMTDILKRLRFVRTVVATQTTGAIALRVQCDNGELPNLQASIQQLGAGAVFTLGTSTLGGTSVLAGSGNINARTPIQGVGRTFRPKWSLSSRWHLKGFAFGFQATKRR